MNRCRLLRLRRRTVRRYHSMFAAAVLLVIFLVVVVGTSGVLLLVEAFPVTPVSLSSSSSLATIRTKTANDNGTSASYYCGRRMLVVARAGFFLDDLLFGNRTPPIPKSPRERCVCLLVCSVYRMQLLASSACCLLTTDLALPRLTFYSNQQIVTAVRAALQSPRTPSLRLLECEFPAVAQLNKLGDGSLRSAQAVDAANYETAQTLVRALSSPLDNLLGGAGGGGPIVWLVTSSAASVPPSVANSNNKINVHSLRTGALPPVKSRDVCVLLAPCNRFDYEAAQRLASNGNAVILVNGFAKVSVLRVYVSVLCSLVYVLAFCVVVVIVLFVE